MRRPILLLALLLLPLSAGCLFFSDHLIDDAYIFFRYADHILAGQGPVFNPGERVEGFTSPLWLLLLVLLRGLGLPHAISVRVLGGALAALTLFATWRLARRCARPLPALLAPALLACHPGFALWSVRGLETPLFLLAVTSAAGLAASGSRAAGPLLGLLIWIRPEAPLIALILILGTAARGERKRAWRMVSWVLLGALPLLAARFAYYGEWVPNTFFAKTGGGAGRLLFGLAAAKSFALAHSPLVVATAVGARLVMRGRARDSERPVLIEWLLIGLAWSAWVVWAGGDAFYGFRFWLPALPFASAICAWALSRLTEAGGVSGAEQLPDLTRRRVAAFGIGVVIVGGCAALSFREARFEQVTGGEFTERMLAAGRWLKTTAPPGTTMALNYVGALPWASGLPAIDMLGLTDKAVARTPIRGRFRFTGHARGNGASVLDRRPDLLLMNGVWVDPEPLGVLAPQLDSEEQIAADARFAAEYGREDVRIPGPRGSGPADEMWFVFWRRRDAAWDPTP